MACPDCYTNDFNKDLFIKRLKEEINNSRSVDFDDRYMVGIEAGLSKAWQIIDKLAGKQLI